MFRTYGKRAIATILSAAMLVTLAACGSTPEGGDDSESSSGVSFEQITDTATEETSVEEEAPVDTDEPYVLPEGMYFSELTGEPISEDIKDQRPIAAMVDNEITALPHFDTTKAEGQAYVLLAMGGRSVPEFRDSFSIATFRTK